MHDRRDDMSSKITGQWPQGRSTSQPYTRRLKPTDAEYIEWSLDERRKVKMMETYYNNEMQEATKDMPVTFEHPWMSEGQKEFTRLVIKRAKQLGIAI